MNSKECLKNAKECMEQAGRAKNNEVQAELLQLAKAWMEIAKEIDGLQDDVRHHPTKRAN